MLRSDPRLTDAALDAASWWSTTWRTIQTLRGRRRRSEMPGRLTHRQRASADRWSAGRVVAVLEGGYDLDGLAVLSAFAGPPAPLAPLPIHMVAKAAIEGTPVAHRNAGIPDPTHGAVAAGRGAAGGGLSFGTRQERNVLPGACRRSDAPTSSHQPWP